MKLRYGLTDSTTVLFTALQNNQANSALCTQFVTPLPCGIGPDNGSSGKFQFMYGTVQSLIGQTAIALTGYVNNNVNLANDLNRYVQVVCDPASPATPGCSPAGSVSTQLRPFESQSSSLARGIAASATLTRDKHTFTLSGSTYAGITTSTPIVDSSGFVRASTFATASRQVQLADSFKVNDKLTLGPNLSYAGTTGAGSSLLAGFSAAWRPTGNDSYNASVSVGSSQPANGLVRSFSDPYSARINCAADTAQVSGPGDQPGHQSALSYDLGWTHSWSKGQVSLNAYRQSQSGQLVGAQVTAASLGLTDPTNPFASAYYQAINGYFSNVCGTPAVPNVYVQQQIGGTTRVYQGFTATGRFGIGKNVVVIPSYSTTVASVTAADPRYIGLDSTLILGDQIPGRPLHTANLTIDALQPWSGVEFLANARYVGANNSQHLAPFTLVNAGISHSLGMGRITVFASNLFNTESGNFSTLQYAQPIPLSGGGTLLQAANPNAPRQYTVTYSFNTGARAGAGFSRGSANAGARGSQTVGAAGTQNAQQRGLGFGRLTFIPPPPGVDPLSVAASRTECTADLKPEAQKVLAAIGAAATAYAAGQPVPAVEGITVTPHGDPKGTWYLGLGANIPQSVIDKLRAARPPDAAGGAGRGPRAGGPGGEPGAGPPGGFQERVTRGVARQPAAAAAVHAAARADRGAPAAALRGLVRLRHRSDHQRSEGEGLRRPAGRSGRGVAGSRREPGPGRQPGPGRRRGSRREPGPRSQPRSGRTAARRRVRRRQRVLLYAVHRVVRGPAAGSRNRRRERQTVAHGSSTSGRRDRRRTPPPRPSRAGPRGGRLRGAQRAGRPHGAAARARMAA